MRQFYVTYRGDEKVPPLVTQLPWTHNLIILSQSKAPEEREFYLKTAIREKWSKRELERQFRGALFERAVLNPPKVSAALAQMQPEAHEVLKDTYLLEFLDLPGDHAESDLQRALIAELRERPKPVTRGSYGCEAAAPARWSGNERPCARVRHRVGLL